MRCSPAEGASPDGPVWTSVTNFPGRHGVEFNKYVLLGDASLSVRRPRSDRIAGRVVGSLIYSLLRAVLEVLVTSRTDQAKLQAEVLVLRRQVQVVERQIKRVQWKPADRMLLAALRERIPRSAWAGLLVKSETVLGWHRALVRSSGQPIERDRAVAGRRSRGSAVS